MSLVKTTTRIVAILLASIIAFVIAGFLLVRNLNREMAGIEDDFKDVKLEEIIAFAERSNSAYHEAKIFRHEFGAHFEDGEFPISGLRVYLDADPAASEQWVVLRGTANLSNIFDDLDFAGREEHELGINVHKGFDLALQECLPWIVQRLDKTRPVRITGHSLGGSVAALLVATLDHRGYADVSAITFGQPKFTDSHGADKLARLKILRIVHDEDPVPLLPPVDVEGASLAIYHHSGPEVIIRADGHFYYQPGHLTGRIDVTRYWQDLGNVRPMSHDMVRGYLPALKSALKSSLVRAPETPPPAASSP
ncbi:MAG: lipase family protein [Verrucomicrobiota bacterium]